MQHFNLRYKADEANKTNIADGFPAHTALEKTFAVSAQAPWICVLAETLDFLSAVYGYDLKEQIFVDDQTGFGPISVREARMAHALSNISEEALEAQALAQPVAE